MWLTMQPMMNYLSEVRWRVLGGALVLTALLSGTTFTSAQEDAPARIAPRGELRVALVVANQALATRSPDGQFSGAGVDLANAFGAKLKLPVRFVPYEALIRYNQSIGRDEWDIGLAARDLARTQSLAFSDPFLEVDEGYVARPGLSLNAADEVDRPGMRVAVAQASPSDGVLTRTLKSAQIVRVPTGLDEAREALAYARADVYGDASYVGYRIAAELPGATVLVGRFNLVRMSVALPKSNAAALPIVNDLLHDARRDGVMAEGIKHAGLRGVRVPR